MSCPVPIEQVLEGRARWTVFEADCVPVLADLPDGIVDHVINDPPFTDRVSRNARTNHNWAPQSDAHAFIDFAGLGPVAPHVRQWLRIARRWCIGFCALEQLGEYEAAAQDAWVRAGVWVKPDGAPQFTGDRPAQAAEGVAIMHRPGKKRWNAGGARGYWLESVVQDRGEIGHPTPKPLPLMLKLIEQFTDPGDLILDPFCGSGTTGIACLRLGRRFVGIERNPTYAALSREGLEAEARLVTRSAYRAGQIGLF
jgi:site-specific DNA-methyltransferase (adenine-specific)